MYRVTHTRALKIALWIAAVLAMAALVTGCGEKAEEKPAAGATAMSSLDAAKSQLSTTAPDAKLLVVQTAAAVPATGTPVWAYLFGSPKTDTIYIVYVDKGEVMPASEYGKAGLSAEEWEAVPDTSAWKIDSDEAYKKALEASGATGDPVQWVMGMVTYIPSTSDAEDVSAFVWNVNFDPGQSGATTGTVQVNATTGEVTAPE